INYTVQDNNGLVSNSTTLSITVTPVNDAPVANPNATTTNEDTPVTLATIQTNDTDVDGTVVTNTIDLDPLTVGQQTTFTVTGQGAFSLSTTTGNVVFTPFLNYNGTTVINYTIKDNNGLVSNNATLTVTINAVNDAPIANTNTITTNEDTPVTLASIQTNDTDVDGTIVTSTIDLDSTAVGQQTTVVTVQGTWVVNTTTGDVTFTPTLNYNGTATINYIVSDNNGAISNQAALIVIVVPVNDAPVANDDNVNTNEDTPVTLLTIQNNDTDVDGNVVTSTIDLDPITIGQQTTFANAQGTWILNSTTGNVVFTAALNFNGLATINYTINDNNGLLSNQATLTAVVNAVNDAPIVDNENVGGNVNNNINGDVTDAGDSDPDGTLLTVNIIPVLTPAHGTFSISSNGNYTYSPDVNYYGADIVVVEVCDNGTPLPALCKYDTIFITMASGLPPVVDNEFITTPEENPAAGDVTNAGDFDPEGGALTTNVLPVFAPKHGTLTVNTNGSYTYTPVDNYNGKDTAIVAVCDPVGLCTNDTLFITITPIADAPVANIDVKITNEDTPVAISVLSNDTDVENDINISSVIVTTAPANGTVLISNIGVVTYTPNANFNGTDQFIYRVCDNTTPTPLCDTAVVFITINAINDIPTLDNEAVTTNEDTPKIGDLTDAGDFDTEGTTLTANTTPVLAPTHGTIVVNANGTYTYTPTANFNGTDIVIVEICDAGLPLPALCKNDTIRITVTPVNDPPIIDNEVLATNEDNPVSGDLTDAGDYDPDGTTLTANTVPTVNPTKGTVVVNADGTFIYTPNLNANGTDMFVISICDAGIPLPPACIYDTVRITINPVNDALIVTNDNASGLPNTAINGDITNGGDFDPDGTTLTVTTAAVLAPLRGTIVMNANGTYIYTPATNYYGLDKAVFTVCDNGFPTPVTCKYDTLFININQGLPPVLDNENIVTNEDTPISSDLTDVGDYDPEGAVLTANTSPIVNPANGTIIVQPNGNYTYTPSPNYNGPDLAIIQICDNVNLCKNDTIRITVTPVNDAPIVNNEYFNINEDTQLANIVLNAGDNDPEGLALNVNTSLALNPTRGTVVMNSNGTFTYTPILNYNGTDKFVALVCDPQFLCVTDTVYITINPINDAPTIVNDVAITNEDTPLLGDVTNPNDVDVDITTLTVNTSPIINPAHGTIVVNTNGTYTYTSTLNYFGKDTVVLSVCDGGIPAPSICVNDTLFITINSVNDIPVTDNETHFTNEDIPVNGDLTDAGDYDVESATLTVNTIPALAPAHGTIVVNSNGNYTYTPAPNYYGLDEVIFQVCDGNSACVNDTIFITVFPINDAPVAINDATGTIPNVDVTISIGANDSDVDGQPLTYTILQQGDSGTAFIKFTDSLIYTPNLNSGLYGSYIDTIIYKVCDGGSPDLCDTAMVFVFVPNTPLAPVAIRDNAITSEDNAVAINTANNDYDSNGNINVSSTVVSTAPKHGTATLNSAGIITYTPALNFNGIDTLIYSVCDKTLPTALCDTALVVIKITAVNDAPVSTINPAVTNEDTPTIGILTATDVDSNPLTFTYVSNNPNKGSVVIDSVGNYVYTPAPNYFGRDTIITSICDADNACVQGILIMVILPVNDAPVTKNEIVLTNENTPYIGDVTGVNDTDVDNDALTVNQVLVNAPNHGTLVINGNGVFTYTPYTSYNGVDTVIVAVCDPSNACNNDTLFIVVKPTSLLPIVDNEVVVVNEDTPILGDFTNAGDYDPQGGTLITSTVPVSGPNHGTILINTNGQYIYTPTLNYYGNDTVLVNVCDNSGNCVNDTLFITLLPINDAPIGIDDVNSGNEDTPQTGSLLTNDIEPDGDPMTVTPATNVVTPNGGHITIAADGSYTYTPLHNFNGVDNYIYQVCDNKGACATAYIILNVTPVNDAPIAANDVGTTAPGVSVIVPIFKNDKDPEGNTLTYTVLTQGDSGTAIITGSNSLQYTPYAGVGTYGPIIDTITYVVCDNASPSMCDTAKVFIYIPVTALPPVITNEDTIATEDTPLTINILTNDYDPNNDSLIITATSGTTPHGTFTITPTGLLTYKPVLNYYGLDTAIVQVCDVTNLCINDTIFINVLPINDAPVVLNDALTTIEDYAYTGTIIANDTDVDNPIFVIYNIVDNANHGTIAFQSAGTFTYTPNLNFNGLDTVVFQIADVGTPQVFHYDTLFITVGPVNDAPIVKNDNAQVKYGQMVTGTILNPNDFDTDSTTLHANTTPVVSPTHGTIVIQANGGYTYNSNQDGYIGIDTVVISVCDSGTPLPAICVNDTLFIKIIDGVVTLPSTTITTPEDNAIKKCITVTNPNGGTLTANLTCIPNHGTATAVVNGNEVCITYTPNLNYNGLDTLCLTVCDSLSCDTITIPVVVNPVTDTLKITNINTTITTPEDSTTTTCVTVVNIDGGILVATLTCGPKHGTATTTVNGNQVCVTYTPSLNYNGLDTVCLTVCNGTTCDTLQVPIVVTPVTDTLKIPYTTITTSEDSTITTCVTVINPDGGTLVATLTCGPNHGTAITSINGNQVCVTYTPSLNYNGLDTLCLTVCNGSTCDTIQVPIVVTPVKDIVKIPNTTIITPEDSTITTCVTVLNPDGGTLVATLTCGPYHGTASTVINGNQVCVTYTPSLNYNGLDTLCLTVCNGTTCDTIQVPIVVIPVADTIKVPKTTITTPQDSTITTCITVVNIDGATLVATLTCGPNHGTATTTVNGNEVCITYTPNAGYNGLDTLCLTICNGALCTTINVPIIVKPRSPLNYVLANFDTASVINGISTTINVQANDSLSGFGSITINTNPTNGTVVVNANGTITYTANEGYIGTDTFIYLLCNNATPVKCDTAIVYINVLDKNELEIPQGFSPNGDGTNDLLVIKGITRYPNNDFKIFNRWGNIVYDVKGYANEWNGNSNKGFTVGGDALPVATYFYILDLGVEGKAPLKGYIYLNK
ncbi:MAG: tandem-95 repeat protein, partial [Bacteroidia bacterium]|nr:tandem-95 repeat protein [Bacteroidia bacterium]